MGFRSNNTERQLREMVADLEHQIASLTAELRRSEQVKRNVIRERNLARHRIEELETETFTARAEDGQVLYTGAEPTARMYALKHWHVNGVHSTIDGSTWTTRTHGGARSPQLYNLV